MDLNLTGKRALVTGSSSGIGRGIAAVLAGEGASVIVHVRNRERAEETAELIRQAGGTAFLAIGDLANDDGAGVVAQAVARHTGGIDILVNNIGGTESYGGQMLSWFEVSAEHWLGTLQQNLISAVRMIHAFVPAMRERGWGRVINISSGGGATRNTEPYAAPGRIHAGISNTPRRANIILYSPWLEQTRMIHQRIRERRPHEPLAPPSWQHSRWAA